jgi:predicted small lipoprotein YifL
MVFLVGWFYSLRSMILLVVLASVATCAQNQPSSFSDANQSWRATTYHSDNGIIIPSRVKETHIHSGNRTVDTQNVEVLDSSGRYTPYLDIETETIQENATTTRSIVRTYNPGATGEKMLVQQRDEEVHTSSGGGVNVVRTISNPDLNGSLRVVQREVADTTKSGPDTQETKTTLYFPDSNGTLAPVSRTQEIQKNSSDGTIQSKTTKILPNGNGGWTVGETKETTIKTDGKNRRNEERVSLPDPEGKLSQVSHTITNHTESNGETTNTVETFSLDVPGLARDGNLHLGQRAVTVEKSNSSGRVTEKQIEQLNSGNPSDGLQATTKTIDIVSSDVSGTQETHTLKIRDPDGGFSTLSVDTRKSDQVPAVTIQIASPQKPK